MEGYAISCLLIERFNTAMKTILQLIYGYDAIIIKFWQICKLKNDSIYGYAEGHRFQNSFQIKNKVGGFMLIARFISFNKQDIELVQVLTNRPVDQNADMNPYIAIHLTYDKSSTVRERWQKDNPLGQIDIPMPIKNLDSQFFGFFFFW